MPTKIIVCGAAGRMGRTIVGLLADNPDVQLSGALEAAASPLVGQDAGQVAGTRPLGVTIQTDLAPLAGPDTVILDFTTAAAALEHLRVAIDRGSAIVIGATGFTPSQLAEIDRLAPQTRSVIASNMSVGIAVLHKLVRAAAIALGPDFDTEIVEIHHKMKIDAPSGTALSLGRTVAEATGRNLTTDAVYGREGVVGRRKPRELGIVALRGGDAVGDHTVIFAGFGERLELTHRTQSRDCLARGAIRAALWVAGQPVGRYAMADVLDLH